MSSLPLSAVGCVVFTVDSAEASGAGTSVTVDTVCAVGSILAGVALTLIDVFLTLCASKSWQADTQEAVRFIHAGASVAARVCGGGRKDDNQLFSFKSTCSVCLVYANLKR